MTVKRSSTTSQPTAMWPDGVCRSLLSARTRTRTTVLATDNAMPNTMPADQSHPNAWPRSAPRTVATALCAMAPGNRDPAHGEQFLDVKLQTDAEHEENDADLRELLGERGVRHESRGVRTDKRSGEQVADDGRESEPLGDVSQNEGGREPAGQRENQVVRMHSKSSTKVLVVRWIHNPVSATS